MDAREVLISERVVIVPFASERPVWHVVQLNGGDPDETYEVDQLVAIGLAYHEMTYRYLVGTRDEIEDHERYRVRHTRLDFGVTGDAVTHAMRSEREFAYADVVIIPDKRAESIMLDAGDTFFDESAAREEMEQRIASLAERRAKAAGADTVAANAKE